METEWASALKEIPPRKVTVNIEPKYIGNSIRPDKFKVTYQIEGELPVTKRIANKAGGRC
ncbi:DNA/RNA non-specific endonuclease [Virgibacillus dakarensis]|uniref:DNA/RNA non-specific endonuclease n=1 Tax=Virgibacillus dakarensis TaxID=1917889 RepID=UPI00190EEA8D|nr:DNA/RNA non-specific endonuclease [Virgibacillus dakarensis]